MKIAKVWVVREDYEEVAHFRPEDIFRHVNLSALDVVSLEVIRDLIIVHVKDPDIQRKMTGLASNVCKCCGR